jgi:hypothetical protein
LAKIKCCWGIKKSSKTWKSRRNCTNTALPRQFSNLLVANFLVLFSGLIVKFSISAALSFQRCWLNLVLILGAFNSWAWNSKQVYVEGKIEIGKRGKRLLGNNFGHAITCLTWYLLFRFFYHQKIWFNLVVCQQHFEMINYQKSCLSFHKNLQAQYNHITLSSYCPLTNSFSYDEGRARLTIRQTRQSAYGRRGKMGPTKLKNEQNGPTEHKMKI